MRRLDAYIRIIEANVRRAAWAGLGVLILVQLGIIPLFPEGALNVVPRLEGIPLEEADDSEPSSGYPVSLEIVGRHSAPRAFLLVNGEPQAAFDDSRLTAHLRIGDLLEVDARRYGALTLRITEAPSWAQELEPGALIEASREIVLIGRLR